MALLSVSFTISMSSCHVKWTRSVFVMKCLAIWRRCLPLVFTAMECSSSTEHFTIGVITTISWEDRGGKLFAGDDKGDVKQMVVSKSNVIGKKTN